MAKHGPLRNLSQHALAISALLKDGGFGDLYALDSTDLGTNTGDLEVHVLLKQASALGSVHASFEEDAARILAAATVLEGARYLWKAGYLLNTPYLRIYDRTAGAPTH